jgi:hypothetical protein
MELVNWLSKLREMRDASGTEYSTQATVHRSIFISDVMLGNLD